MYFQSNANIAFFIECSVDASVFLGAMTDFDIDYQVINEISMVLFLTQ